MVRKWNAGSPAGRVPLNWRFTGMVRKWNAGSPAGRVPFNWRSFAGMVRKWNAGSPGTRVVGAVAAGLRRRQTA
jgi:hypothetical protein